MRDKSSKAIFVALLLGTLFLPSAAWAERLEFVTYFPSSSTASTADEFVHVKAGGDGPTGAVGSNFMANARNALHSRSDQAEGVGVFETLVAVGIADPYSKADPTPADPTQTRPRLLLSDAQTNQDFQIGFGSPNISYLGPSSAGTDLRFNTTPVLPAGQPPVERMLIASNGNITLRGERGVTTEVNLFPEMVDATSKIQLNVKHRDGPAGNGVHFGISTFETDSPPNSANNRNFQIGSSDNDNTYYFGSSSPGTDFKIITTPGPPPPPGTPPPPPIERLRVSSEGNVGIGTYKPDYNSTSTLPYTLTLGGTVGHAIGIEPNPNPNGEGASLTIVAGYAETGGTQDSVRGGNLLLSSGQSKGNLASGITFRTAPNSSPGQVNIPEQRMDIGGTGSVSIGDGDVQTRASVFNVTGREGIQDSVVFMPWREHRPNPPKPPADAMLVGIGTVWPRGDLHIHNSNWQGRLVVSGTSDGGPNGETFSALYLGANFNDGVSGRTGGAGVAPDVGQSWVIAHKNRGRNLAERNALHIGRWVDPGDPTGLNVYLAIKPGGGVAISSGNLNFVDATEALEVAGNVKAEAFPLRSDARLKENIVPLTGVLDKMKQIRAVTYQWNELYQARRYGMADGQQKIGLIAQEVEKVFPQLVTSDPDGYKSMDYNRFVPLLLEAVKELKTQNEELRGQVQTLQKRIDGLEKKQQK